MRTVLISNIELNHLLLGESIGGDENGRLYLSERNVRVLISKLLRAENGEYTARTLIKNDTAHASYPCSESFIVTALGIPVSGPRPIITCIPDNLYYIDREPGQMHDADEVNA